MTAQCRVCPSRKACFPFLLVHSVAQQTLKVTHEIPSHTPALANSENPVVGRYYSFWRLVFGWSSTTANAHLALRSEFGFVNSWRASVTRKRQWCPVGEQKKSRATLCGYERLTWVQYGYLERVFSIQNLAQGCQKAKYDVLRWQSSSQARNKPTSEFLLFWMPVL